MTEDDAWKMLEEKQKAEELNRVRLKAWDASGTFVDKQSTQLGMITLRRAFEIGYRAGYQDALDGTKK